nr:FecR domain-containing protein [uncultured Achromobacter sp.]
MNPSEDPDRLRREAEQWWLRLRDRDATRGDAEAMKQWRARSPSHARAWNEVARLWQDMDPVLRQAVRRDPGLAHPPARGPSRPARRAFLGAMAAGGAAVAVWPPLSLWPSLLDFTADFRTGTAEQRELALSDQLRVQMNTQTRINQRGAQAGNEAIELVAGEAQVEAAGGGAPVVVYAGAGATRARQARFNLRYTGPQVCVTCLQGSVQVEAAGAMQTLAQGEQVIYDDAGLQPALAADTVQVDAWRTGTLSFAGQTLAEVVDEINRYRAGRVLVRNADLAARRVRMRFEITQTDLALHMLRDLYGAQLTRLPGGIVLLS